MNFQFSILNNKRKGFTIIEALVFLFIFVVTVLSFYNTIVSGVVGMVNAKAKIGATKVANEQLEMIRNIEYENIALTTDIPAGIIENNRQISRGNTTYYINTNIHTIDDAFDGVGVADNRPDDYKEAVVRVFWENGNVDKSILAKGIFIPPGIEEVHSGGVLKVKVIDTLNQPISGAKVVITNSENGVTKTDFTNTEGYILLTQVPESIQKYKITVTKNDYYTVHSYDPNPISPYMPVEVHGTVLDGNYNESSLVTDKLASFKIKTKDISGNNAAGIEFELTGGKLKGHTLVVPPAVAENLYEFEDTSLTTNTDGEKEFDDMSYGSYFFKFKNLPTKYEFIKVKNAISKNNQFDIASTNSEVEVFFADKEVNSLLVRVVDKNTLLPIDNEDVNLKNSSISYDVTMKTDNFGQAYFPDAGILVAGNYDLSIAATGYQQYHEDGIAINTGILIDKTIELNP